MELDAQAWIGDFLAKEKEVSGIKDEPKKEGEAGTSEATDSSLVKAEGTSGTEEGELPSPTLSIFKKPFFHPEILT